MRILLGTTNPSKVTRFSDLLKGYDVEFVTLKDLAITDEPEENGTTPEENAIAKAKFYGQYFEVVICNDSGLYFEELALDDVRQPGLNVRTPMQMDRLSDEEMIDKASSKRFEGWPLDSLSMNKETGKYFVDGSMEESKENIIKDEYEKEIVDLDKNLFSAKGYYYAGILSGKFLDENVGTNRTSFEISDTAEDGSEISMDDIISNVAENVQIYLADYLSEVKGKKEERVRSYIKDEAPQYGHLLKYMREDVEAIKPYLPDCKLDDELYKIKRKFDNQLKKDNQDIIKTLEVGATSLDSYQEKFQKQFAKISEANKASLAEYVAHRKVILELLKKGIQSDDFGKYSKEAYIHNLIYPMRRTSDEIEYQAHNLWLIDERLAYCEYVSSDIPFDNNPREDRTDVMILDKPVAVSDEPNTGREYETIVILELKKPMRNDYTQAENPIIQMLGYVDKISSNEMKDKNGRLIKTGTNTQFYLYAVCDITSKLRKIAEDFDFIETPDKRGMYKYHDKKRAYIEILSFDKIIDDAGKRNRILFEKLGI